MAPRDDITQPVGIWRALGEFKLRDALWPEGLLALLIGGGGAVMVIDATKASERAAAAGDVLILSGAFFGIVFAALAIIVSLPSESYMRMLQATPGGGIRTFLEPFLVAAGTQVALLLLSIGYQLLAPHVDSAIEHAAFAVIGFLFVFGVLDIAGLSRQLVRHGILRAADAELVEPRPDAGGVRRLPHRGA